MSQSSSNIGLAPSQVRASLVAAAVFLLLDSHSAHGADIDLARPMPTIEHRTAIAQPPGDTTHTIKLTAWRSAVLTNELVGVSSQGLFCSGGTKLFYSKRLDDWFVQHLGKAFRDRATALGYAAPESAKSVFDSTSANDADFRLGATLLAFDHRICGSGEVKGAVYAKIKWELFSVRGQKVVYTVSVESGFATDKSMPEREFDTRFLEASVDNLFADPALAEVLGSGSLKTVEQAPAYAPLQVVAGTAVSGNTTSAAASLLAAVVTIESSVGSGSAFYVSHDGYLLTNEHVLGGSKFVRVKLASGKSLVGEVLRSDKARDVALVRTDPVAIDVLRVRREDVQIGEDVYALGSPFGSVLSGTLTRGVLSSKRVFDGVGYLQSDVAVNPGNSGGPLIDAHGQVLGITQLGLKPAVGLNIFIPIDDALDKLGLDLSAATSLPR